MCVKLQLPKEKRHKKRPLNFTGKSWSPQSIHWSLRHYSRTGENFDKTWADDLKWTISHNPLSIYDSISSFLIHCKHQEFLKTLLFFFSEPDPAQKKPFQTAPAQTTPYPLGFTEEVVNLISPPQKPILHSNTGPVSRAQSSQSRPWKPQPQRVKRPFFGIQRFHMICNLPNIKTPAWNCIHKQSWSTMLKQR